MPRIFISYRREDASAYAGRLFDRLSAQYGRDRIFMDVDSLEPGADFGEAIEQTVGSCDVLIAVIGRQWLDAKDAGGARRLENPEDFVRLEVASALARKIRVIPLLVGTARMPRSDDLPEPLKSLARRNAFEVSDVSFHDNVARLISALNRVDEAIRSQAAATPPQEPPAPSAAAVSIAVPSAAPPQPAPVAAAVVAQAEALPPPVSIAAAPGPVATPIPAPPLGVPHGVVPQIPSDEPSSIANAGSTPPQPLLWKALLAHLLFGFGLFYLRVQNPRKFVYPVFAGYAAFDALMAKNDVPPFKTVDFGEHTFLLSLGLFAAGFIDVIVSFRRIKSRQP